MRTWPGFFPLFLIWFALAGCDVQVSPTLPVPVAITQPTSLPPEPTAAPPDTPTLTPGSSALAADPGLPCQIVATRTPPPGAPTWNPEGPDPGNTFFGPVVDPHVELCFSATSAQVGEQVMIYAQAVDIGLPIYALSADSSSQSAVLLEVRVNPRAGAGENPVTVIGDGSAILGFVRAELRGDTVIFVLEARAAGMVSGSVGASGEVHYGYPGPAMWSGGGSDPFTITVAP